MKKMKISTVNRIYRISWKTSYALFFRFTPNIFFSWRRLILRSFGANIAPGARVYPSARIWSPSNLILKEQSCIGPGTNIYNVDLVEVGVGAVLSQDVEVCTATKNYWDGTRSLLVAPVVIEDGAWIASGAFICPGVRIGEGSAILARCFIAETVPPRHVVRNGCSLVIEAIGAS